MVSFGSVDPELNFQVDGSEDWLRAARGLLAHGQQSSLRGHIDLKKLSHGDIQVQGQLVVLSPMDCSLCGNPLPTEFVVAIEGTYRKGTEHLLPERDLSAEEIDLTYSPSGEIDLADLVRDCLSVHVPQRVVTLTDQGDACRTCHKVISGDQVYSGPSNETAPFRDLARWKKH